MLFLKCNQPLRAVSYTHLDVYKRQAISVQLIHVIAQAQIMTINAATVTINSAWVWVNGGVDVVLNSTALNNGTLTVTKNSTLPSAGTFAIRNTSTVSGNGTYNIEQDWINDAVFNSGTSIVSLYGNTQQFITSNNGTITTCLLYTSRCV